MADLPDSGNLFAHKLAAGGPQQGSAYYHAHMPKLDLTTIAVKTGADYPAPFHEPVARRVRQRLGDAGGLTQFGVNRVELPPGCWSGQRHWHTEEDEFVYVIAGEVVLVTDQGEQLLRAGDCAAFPANTPNAHHLINRSATGVVCLEVGSRRPNDRVLYTDIGMTYDAAAGAYFHNDGTDYCLR